MGLLQAIAPAERAKNEALSDELIVEKVLDGQTEMFELIMRRHNQRIYRIARAILGEEAEAEDVMQDAYVRAFSHLGQFANRASFAAWLTRIAVNEALARLRRGARVESLEDIPEEAGVSMSLSPTVPSSPEHQTFNGELKALLEKAIDALPPDYRVVFMMREVEELSTEETAACLGITPENVKTRAHRARRMLQRRLVKTVGSATAAAFQFPAVRCNRVVDAVLGRIVSLAYSPTRLGT